MFVHTVIRFTGSFTKVLHEMQMCRISGFTRHMLMHCHIVITELAGIHGVGVKWWNDPVPDYMLSGAPSFLIFVVTGEGWHDVGSPDAFHPAHWGVAGTHIILLRHVSVAMGV